ncbi:MAG: PD40 domain-containing protein [Magnetococcales bacterium]|nr:PD40 domain-containing protein [Magnetococcales bacterium]
MKPRLSSLFLTLLLPFVSIGCGGGGSGNTNSPSSALSGTVIEGAVKNATISVYNGAGTVVATTKSGDDAKYTLAIPSGTTLPLEIKASGGTDLVTGETLTVPLSSLVTQTGQNTANISPITTMITQASKAKSGGSLANVTVADVETVQTTVIKNFGFGIDGDDAKINPISSPVTSANLAAVTKASEGMGETVRRIAGTNAQDQEKIFAALAEDLVDGKLDGKQSGTPLQSSLPGNMDASTFVATAIIQTTSVVAETLNNALEVTKTDGSKMSSSDVKSAMATSMQTMDPTIDAASARNKMANALVSDTLKKQAVAYAYSAQAMFGSSSNTYFQQLHTSFNNLVVGKEAATQIDKSLAITQKIQEDYIKPIVSKINQAQYSASTIQKALNQPPQVESSVFKTVRGQPVSGVFSGVDHNGDPLTFRLKTDANSPGKGSVTLTNTTTGAFTYTPGANEMGIDHFAFLANDGTIDSNVANITIVIATTLEENMTPITRDTQLNALVGTTLQGKLEGIDPEGGELTFAIASQPTGGTLLLEESHKGYFTYTPNSTTPFSDSFTYTVSDGTHVSDPARLDLFFLQQGIDTDEDGVTDSADNCPLVANTDQKDTDKDGAGDVCDVFVNDAQEQLDSDGDGIGNLSDTDDDNDGVTDLVDLFPLNPKESKDSDHDHTGDNSDIDRDGDGVPNAWDAQSHDPAQAQVTATLQLQRSGSNQYLLPVKVGNQFFNLLVDTGSDALLVFGDKIAASNTEIVQTTSAIKKSYASGIRSGVLATAPVKVGPFATQSMHLMVIQSPTSGSDPSLTAKGADGIIGFRRTRGVDLSVDTTQLDATFNLLTPQVDKMEFNLPPVGPATISLGSMPILDRAKSQYVFRAKALPITNPYNPSAVNEYTDLQIPFRAKSRLGSIDTGSMDMLLDSGAVSKLVLDTKVAEAIGYDSTSQKWTLSDDDEVEINLIGLNGTAPILPKFKVSEISVAPYSSLGVAFEAVLGVNRWQEYVIGYDYRTLLNDGPDATISLLRRLDMADALEATAPGLGQGFVPLPGLNSIANDELPSADDTGTLVAFQSDRAESLGGTDIFLWRKGVGLVDLPGLNHTGHDLHPRLSADGHFLVYESTTQRVGGTDQDIFLYDIEQKTPIDISALNSTADDTWPAISGDGRFITLSSKREGGAGGSDIYLYDRQTAQFVALPDVNSAKDERTPDIRRDGLFLTYTIEAANGPEKEVNRDIALYDLQQKKTVSLSTDIRGVNTGKDELSPSLSANGQLLALHSNRKNPDGGLFDRDLYLVDLRSGIARKHPGLNSDFDDTAPRFIESDSKLIFQSRRAGGEGGTDIYLYDLTGAVASGSETPRQHEAIPLKQTATGLFMTPVTVAGQNLDLLVDTTLGAMILFTDAMPNGIVVDDKQQPQTISLGLGQVSGRIATSDIQIGNRDAKKFNLIVASRQECATALNMDLQGAMGIFGINGTGSSTGSGQPPTAKSPTSTKRFAGSDQPPSTTGTTTGSDQPPSTTGTTTGSDQPPSTTGTTTGSDQPTGGGSTISQADVPLSKLLPEVNMLELSINANGTAGMTLGYLPQIGGLSKHKAFYTGVMGQMNPTNPNASSVSMGIPFFADGLAVGAQTPTTRFGGDQGFNSLEKMSLLLPGSLLTDRIQMDTQVATALGYNQQTGSWGEINRVSLSLVMFGSDNSLKIADSVPVSKIDVTNFSAKSYRIVLGRDYWSGYILGFDTLSFQNGGPAGMLFLVRHEEALSPASAITEADHHFVKLPGLNGIGDDMYGDISHDEQIIVFQSNRPGGAGDYDIQVYRMGEGLLSYSGINSDKADTKPSISGDGRLVAFQTERTQGNGQDILVYDLQTKALLDLPELSTTDIESEPDLNADGTRLLFNKKSATSAGSDSNIVLYDLVNKKFIDTSSDQIKTRNNEGAPTIGGKDSLLYAFTRENATDHSRKIILYNRSRNTAVKTSEGFASRFRDDNPNLSTDGDYLVFQSNRNDPDLQHLGNDLFLYELSSQEFIFLPSINSNFEEGSPALTKNARHILFHSKREGGQGGYDLYLYQRDTKDTTQYQVTESYSQSGQVTYENGQIAANTTVSALDMAGNVITTAATNAQGQFSMNIAVGQALPTSYKADANDSQVIVDGVGDDTYVPDFEAGNLKFTDVWVEDVMQSAMKTTVRFNITAEQPKYNSFVKLYLVKLPTGNVSDLNLTNTTNFKADYILTALNIPTLGQSLASKTVTNTQDVDTVTTIQYTSNNFLSAQVEHSFRLPVDITAGTYAVVFSIGQYDYDHTDDALQSESASNQADNILVAPASVLVGQPDKPNLRILSATLGSNSLELPAKRLDTDATPPTIADLSLNMEVESMAQDTTVPVNVTAELQLGGQTFPLGIMASDARGRPYLQSAKSYEVSCVKEKGADRCASLFRQSQRGFTYKLYLNGAAYDTIAQLHGDTQGTLVIRLDPEGNVSEWENNRADNVKEMPVMFLATSHAATAAGKSRHARYYDSNGSATSFVSMGTSESYGSTSTVAVGYTLGADVTYGDITNNVPHAAEFDASSNEFAVWIFGQKISLLGLDTGAQFDGNDPYCSDMNLDITVLGVNILAYSPPDSTTIATTVYDLISGYTSSSCKSKTATKVESLWVSQDTSGNELYIKSTEKTEEKQFMIGPVPVVVTGGAEGSAGLQGSLSINATQKLSSSVGPFLNITGFAEVGVGLSVNAGAFSLSAVAGVGMSLTIVDITLTMDTSFQLNEALPAAMITFETPLVLTTMDGEFYAYVEVGITVKLGFIKIEKEYRYSYTIFSWNGYTTTINLTDPRAKTFAALDRYAITKDGTLQSYLSANLDYTSSSPPGTMEWAGTFNFAAGTYDFHLITDDAVVAEVNNTTLAQLPYPSSSTQIVDKVSGYTGTLTNGPTISTTEEALSSATITAGSLAKGSIDLDGSNDYVSFSSSLRTLFQATTTGTGGTIEHWIKPDTTPDDMILLFVGDTSSSDGFGDSSSRMEIHTGISNGKPFFMFQKGGESDNGKLTGTTTINSGTWYHIAATYELHSGGTSLFKLYVNGVLEASKSWSTTFSTKTATGMLLGRPSASTRYFNGKIDELRLWNTVRTQSEISSNKSVRLPATTSGLYAYYTFDDRYTALSSTTSKTFDTTGTYDVSLTYTKDTSSKTSSAMDIDFYWEQANYSGYSVAYYNTTDLSSTVVWRTQEPSINHQWNSSSPTGETSTDSSYLVNPAKFSARWTKSFSGFENNTTWIFQVTSDDGARLYLDGTSTTPIINTWSDTQTATVTTTSALQTLSSSTHTLTFDYQHEASRKNSAGSTVTVDSELSMTYLPVNKWLKTGVVSSTDNNVEEVTTPIGLVSDISTDVASLGSPDYEFMQYQKFVYFSADGTYDFIARTNPGMVITIDGKEYKGGWAHNSATSFLSSVYLTAGYHAITVRLRLYDSFTSGGTKSLSNTRVGDVSWSKQETGVLTGYYYRTVDDLEASKSNTDSASKVVDPILIRKDSPLTSGDYVTALQFDWGSSSPTFYLQPVDTELDSANTNGKESFGIRWEGNFDFTSTNTNCNGVYYGDSGASSTEANDTCVYLFTVQADDKVRLWVDDRLVVDQWTSVTDTRTTHETTVVSAGVHKIKVEYTEETGSADIMVSWRLVTAEQMYVNYFNSSDFTGQPVNVTTAGLQTSATLSSTTDLTSIKPTGLTTSSTFSAVGSGMYYFDESVYNFSLKANSGAVLYVDNIEVINAWSGASGKTLTSNWPMEEGYHNIRIEWYDTSSNPGVNLSWTNENKVSDSGMALVFDGLNDTATIPGYTGITGTSARTIETWIKTTTLDRAFLYWGSASSGAKWLMRTESNGSLRVEISGGSLSGTTSISDGNWHHVAVTFENDGTPNITDCKLYVDGVQETSFYAKNSLAINTASSSDVLIGKDNFSRYFTGQLDELRIWSVARTATEIADYKNRTLDGTETGLAVYYKFDEGYGSVLEDFLGSHDGTIADQSGWIISGAPIYAH